MFTRINCSNEMSSGLAWSDRRESAAVHQGASALRPLAGRGQRNHAAAPPETTGCTDGATAGASLGSRTRHTRIAARNRNTPPATTADNRLLSSTCDITQPKPNDATISGITMKKLKIPMYTPVFSLGNEPARMAYGMERMLAQASPTPTMESNSSFG